MKLKDIPIICVIPKTLNLFWPDKKEMPIRHANSFADVEFMKVTLDAQSEIIDMLNTDLAKAEAKLFEAGHITDKLAKHWAPTTVSEVNQELDKLAETETSIIDGPPNTVDGFPINTKPVEEQLTTVMTVLNKGAAKVNKPNKRSLSSSRRKGSKHDMTRFSPQMWDDIHTQWAIFKDQQQAYPALCLTQNDFAATMNDIFGINKSKQSYMRIVKGVIPRNYASIPLTRTRKKKL